MSWFSLTRHTWRTQAMIFPETPRHRCQEHDTLWHFTFPNTSRSDLRFAGCRGIPRSRKFHEIAHFTQWNINAFLLGGGDRWGRRRWQATPCFSEEKHKIELVKRFRKFQQWIKAIALDRYLIVTLNFLALLIFLVKRFSISLQVSSCNILATCPITSICYSTVPATRAPPLTGLRLLPTSWFLAFRFAQYCNSFTIFRCSYQFLWAGLYDSMHSRNRKHAPCFYRDLI